MNTSFAQLLQQWRQARRYSQFQLALETGISSRHLSFLETGRSQPSREMILKLTRFLLIPKLETNQALLAAGFAPIYVEQPSLTDLKPVVDAIELMLSKHLPYPALVFNPDWDIVNANSAAQNLLTHFNYQGNNFIEFLIQDHLQKKLIVNWLETAENLLQRIHQESLVKGISPKIAQLEKHLTHQLATYPQPKPSIKNPIILSIQVQIDQQILSFFSVLAQLSSVQDLTLSDYHIELMFPADAATTAFYQNH